MVGNDKSELRKQCHKKEDNQRIGECHQECRPRIIPDSTSLHTRLTHILRRVYTVGIDTKT